jgi:hypothetical protein
MTAATGTALRCLRCKRPAEFFGQFAGGLCERHAREIVAMGGGAELRPEALAVLTSTQGNPPCE